MIYFILLLIIILLIGIIIIQNKKINYIADMVKEIKSGNLTERIRIQNHNRAIKKLVKNLNNFIDKFQKVANINKNYEEDRKKMISNISHDLRTPLTALLGYIEFIKDNDLNSEKSKEYIEIIDEKGNILRNLMEEFFQLSKLESNDVSVEIKKVNISEIVRQNVILFYEDFIKKDIEPVINMQEEDIYALGDESAVNRVLNNLISNSLKYGSDGNIIGINIRDEEKMVYIDVWDKGRGIPKDNIPYIFDRLYTTEKSRNRKLQGSGLGLTIVKKLLEKQKGEIKVSSVPYEKTIFTFNLPKAH